MSDCDCNYCGKCGTYEDGKGFCESCWKEEYEKTALIERQGKDIDNLKQTVSVLEAKVEMLSTVIKELIEEIIKNPSDDD